jgi:hypothetical protein
LEEFEGDEFIESVIGEDGKIADGKSPFGITSSNNLNILTKYLALIDPLTTHSK